MKTLALRYHSEPCPHTVLAYQTGPSDDLHWACTFYGCPGGKEITYRRQPIAVMGGLTPAWYPTDEDPDFDVLVEVTP